MSAKFDLGTTRGTVNAFGYIVAIGLFMLITLGMTLTYFFKSKQLDVDIAEINNAVTNTWTHDAKTKKAGW